MGLATLTGRFGKAVLLLVVGAVAGAAAAAIAAVPANDGVINACYQVQKDGTTPATGAANVRIIDPSAGQSCNSSDEQALSWNVTGPPGPEGVAGAPGAQGAAGSQGASGPPGSTVSIDGQTFTLGDGKTLAGATGPIPPLEAPPGAPEVGTMTLGSGGGATSSGVLAWQLVGGPGASARGIQVVMPLDKASPILVKACANGKHIPVATLTVRKADAEGGPQTIVLTNATVVSYAPYDDKGKGGDESPKETVTFEYGGLQVHYGQ